MTPANSHPSQAIMPTVRTFLLLAVIQLNSFSALKLYESMTLNQVYLEQDHTFITSTIDFRTIYPLIKKSRQLARQLDQHSDYDYNKILMNRIDLVENELFNMDFMSTLKQKRTSTYVNEQPRFKRGLFDAVGHISHILFGTADPDTYNNIVTFYNETPEKISRIIEVENQLMKEIALEHKLLNSTTSELFDLMQEVDLNHKSIKQLGKILLISQNIGYNLEQTYFVLRCIQYTLIDGKKNMLNTYAISPDSFSRALSTILVRRPGYNLPFNRNNINRYYNSPLTSVTRNAHIIKTITRIPLIDKNDPLKMELAPRSSIMPEDQPHYILRYETGEFRYLFNEDYERCLSIDRNNKLCAKREIRIKEQNRFDCTSNCENIYIYDLSHTNILIRTYQDTKALLTCKLDSKQVLLPTYSILELPENCKMEGDNFFVGKINHPTYEKVASKVLKPKILNITDFSLKHNFSKLSDKQKKMVKKFDSKFEEMLNLHDLTAQKLNDTQFSLTRSSEQTYHTYIALYVAVGLIALIGAGVYVHITINAYIWKNRRATQHFDLPTAKDHSSDSYHI